MVWTHDCCYCCCCSGQWMKNNEGKTMMSMNVATKEVHKTVQKIEQKFAMAVAIYCGNECPLTVGGFHWRALLAPPLPLQTLFSG